MFGLPTDSFDTKENKKKWKRKKEAFLITLMTFIIGVMFLNLLFYDNSENDINYNYYLNDFKIVCYYQFPRGKADLLPKDIPNLCSHINLAFASVNCSDNSLSLSTDNLKIIPSIVSLKNVNRDLKIILSVGGAGDKSFSCMVANHANRKSFIRSAMVTIKNYELDGIDLDWEWPVFDGGSKEKVKFIQLLYEIREEFNRHEKKYLLTAAVAAVESIIDTAYYVRHMAEHVDFVNVMTYDYHFFQTYYPLTDYNAPLYASSQDENSLLAPFNVNYSIHYWISQSMPKEKLVLGIPSYGHTYMLSSSLNQGRHAPATGIGSIGANGFASYFEICDFLKKQGSSRVFDNETKVPYAYNFLDWISYDDEISIKIKAEYIMKNQLGGAMVWSLNNDDFAGSCGKNSPNFPLIRTIHSVFFSHDAV